MPDKVVIRVVNTQTLRQQEKPAPREIVEYHWHRIFGALLLVIAVLAGLIWGGIRLFKQDGSPSAVAEQAPGARGTASMASAIDQAPAIRHAAEQPKGPVTVPSGAANLRSEVVTSPGKASDKRAVAGEPQAQAKKEPDAAASKDVTDASRNAVAILSRSIKRAQLTSNVVEGEPVDSIGPVIPMNERGLVRVYLFMETAGLKGQTLYHDWYWNGKRMAHARIPIKRKETVSSSKFIDRIMTGAWEVRIVDGRDNVLGRTSFEVR